MFVLSVLFWLCPSCKWKCNKQESVTSWMSSPINLAMYFTINLFCHTAGRVQMGGSSHIFLQKSVLSSMFKRQWISCSHLSKNSFPLSYPFCENSTGYVCQLFPLDAHKGSLALDAVFTIYKKVNLFLSLERGSFLTELSLYQSALFSPMQIEKYCLYNWIHSISCVVYAIL